MVGKAKCGEIRSSKPQMSIKECSKNFPCGCFHFLQKSQKRIFASAYYVLFLNDFYILCQDLGFCCARVTFPSKLNKSRDSTIPLGN